METTANTKFDKFLYIYSTNRNICITTFLQSSSPKFNLTFCLSEFASVFHHDSSLILIYLQATQFITYTMKWLCMSFDSL